MHVASAGHFPPVIARPGQPAELAEVRTGLMIGVAPDAQRPVSTVPVPPGALLCFYTDGLVERPGELIDDGLTRLCRAVTAQLPGTACAAVMGALVGSEPARGDTCEQTGGPGSEAGGRLVRSEDFMPNGAGFLRSLTARAGRGFRCPPAHLSAPGCLR